MDRLLPVLFFLLFAAGPVFSQTTLVKGAPSQTFDLSCAGCSLTVEDVALWKGIRLLPYNRISSGMVNYLHWKYYDSISKSEVTTSSELPWEKCTQLLDLLPESDTLSLQINLSWTDSLEQTHRLYLLVGGLLKSDLAETPLLSELHAGDDLTLKRFSAIAQIRPAVGKPETYEAISGAMTLQQFNYKTGTLSGDFEFEGNCIGLMKLGIFNGGVFERK